MSQTAPPSFLFRAPSCSLAEPRTLLHAAMDDCLQSFSASASLLLALAPHQWLYFGRLSPAMAERHLPASPARASLILPLPLATSPASSRRPSASPSPSPPSCQLRPLPRSTSSRSVHLCFWPWRCSPAPPQHPCCCQVPRSMMTTATPPDAGHQSNHTSRSCHLSFSSLPLPSLSLPHRPPLPPLLFLHLSAFSVPASPLSRSLQDATTR